MQTGRSLHIVWGDAEADGITVRRLVGDATGAFDEEKSEDIIGTLTGLEAVQFLIRNFFDYK